MKLEIPGRVRRTYPPRSMRLRYALAVAAVGVAWLARENVLTQGVDRAPFLAFGLAVLLSSLIGGLGPGLLALTLGSVVAVFFYLPPYLALAVHSAFDVVQLGFFIVEGALAAVAGETVRRSLLKVEPVTRMSDRFERVLERAEHLRGLRPEHDERLIEPLTERELEVARLMALGYSNDQIAATLFLSRNTIKTHVRHIYEKLAVTSRTEAVARCLSLGILGTAAAATDAGGSTRPLPTGSRGASPSTAQNPLESQ